MEYLGAIFFVATIHTPALLADYDPIFYISSKLLEKFLCFFYGVIKHPLL